jgi:hypothetical protein
VQKVVLILHFLVCALRRCWRTASPLEKTTARQATNTKICTRTLLGRAEISLWAETPGGSTFRHGFLPQCLGYTAPNRLTDARLHRFRWRDAKMISL